MSPFTESVVEEAALEWFGARGLMQVVDGLATIRNKMNAGHARERKPEAHYARAIVNAAKTDEGATIKPYLIVRTKGNPSISRQASSLRMEAAP